MQQGAGDFHAAAMAAIQFADLFPAPLTQRLALQLGLDPQRGFTARQAMQRGVVPQVLFDAEVQVQRALLEHHAELAQCCTGRLAQGMTADLDVAAL